jgi:sigma-B regulation protein RsbU (phosphoserine phosphatase)
MQPGELLCLVTDGVLDAQNPAGERFGSQRLHDLLARARNGELTARAVVDTVFGEANSFVNGAESADDMTVLALRWLGPGIA